MYLIKNIGKVIQITLYGREIAFTLEHICSYITILTALNVTL